MATVIQELETSQAATTAALAEVDTLKANLASAEAANGATVAELKREIDARDAKLLKLDEDLKAAEQLLAGEQAAHAATKTELEKAQRALANPAYADAAVKGSSKATEDAGQPASGATLTFDEAHREYIRVRDTLGAKAAAEFRALHADVLKLK